MEGTNNYTNVYEDVLLAKEYVQENTFRAQ